MIMHTDDCSWSCNVATELKIFGKARYSLVYMGNIFVIGI